MSTLSLNEAKNLINRACIEQKINQTGDYLKDYILLINSFLDESPIYFEYKYPFTTDNKYLSGEKLVCLKATEVRGGFSDDVTQINLYFNSDLQMQIKLKGGMVFCNTFTWQMETLPSTTIDFERLTVNKKQLTEQIKRQNHFCVRRFYAQHWLIELHSSGFLRDTGFLSNPWQYHNEEIRGRKPLVTDIGCIYRSYPFFSLSNHREVYLRIWDVLFIEDQSAIDEFKMGLQCDYFIDVNSFVVLSPNEVKDFVEVYEYEFTTEMFRKEYIYEYQRLAELFVFDKKLSSTVIAGNTSIFVSAKKGVKIDLKTLCNEFLEWLKDYSAVMSCLKKLFPYEGQFEKEIEKEDTQRKETIKYVEKYIMDKF